MILYFTGTGNSRYIAEKIAKETEDKIININDKIKQKDNSFIKTDGRLIFVVPTYAWRIPVIVKADAFKVDDKCIGCDKCEQICPLNNIWIQNGKPVWGKNCTHCMARICHCPVEAIEYGKKSVGKPRYHI